MGRKSKFSMDNLIQEKKEAKAKIRAEKEAREAKVKAPIISGPVSKRTYDLKEYSKEELAKIVSDYTRTNSFRLKGLDSRYEYRFINRKDDRLDRRVMMGWEIVTGPDAELIASESGLKLRQGQVILSDGVLARMPKQIALAIRQRCKDLGGVMIKESSKALKRDVGEQYSRNVEESLKVRSHGFKEQTVI
jgi:hypothetical protein